MKKRVTAILMLGVLAIGMTTMTGCESWNRTVKSVKSDVGGGLPRTVTLYSYNGDELDSWTGKFDVSESTNEVFFDIDGKRVIIHGGIVVNEEITVGDD